MDTYFNDFVSDLDHAAYVFEQLNWNTLCNSAWLDDDDLDMLDDLADLDY